MAAPVIESTDTDTDNSITATVTMPAGIQVGELLLVIFHIDTRHIQTAPSGWTEVIQAPTNACQVGVWYRVADGTELSSYDFDLNIADGWCSVVCRVSGAEDPATESIVVESANGFGVKTSPSITPTSDDSLVIRLAGLDTDTITVTPSGETQLYLVDEGTISGGASYFEHGASATGTGSFDSDLNDGWSQVTLAIAPSSGSGGATPTKHLFMTF